MKRLGMILLAGCLLAFVPPYPHAPTQEYVGGELLADFVGGDAPTVFDAHFDSSGVDSLPGGSCGALEINGQSLSPFFCLDARDATASTWPARVGSAVFTLTGTGDDPAQLETAFLDGTQEVRRQATGKSWVDPGYSSGDFGTDDFVFLAIHRKGSSLGNVLGFNYPSANPRAVITQQNTNLVTAVILDGTATATVNGPGLTTLDAVAVTLGAFDRNSALGGAIYSNGIKGTTVDISAVYRTLTPTSGTIGAMNQSSVDGGLLYYAIYKAADWLDTAESAEVQNLAAELFARFNGTYANRADDRVPTFTRASVATIQNTTTGAVTTVPSGWPVVEENGFRPESAATNEALYSDLSTGWTSLQGSIAVSTTIRAPGGAFAQEYTENATAGVAHGFYQNLTYTAAGYVSAIYAKEIDHRWIYSRNGAASARGTVWFDLTNGVVGTETNANGYITDIGGGWYRCEVEWTADANASNAFFVVTDSDGSLAHNGDGTSRTAWWGAQLELDNGTGRASSYIPTAGSAVALADSLFNYDHTISGADSAIIDVGFTADALDTSATSTLTNYTVAGGGWANAYLMQSVLTSGVLRARVRSPLAVSDATSVFSVVPDDSYSLRMRYRINTTTQIQTIDGAIDGSATPPTDSLGTLTELHIGNSWPGDVGDGTHIKRIRILDY